MHPAFTKMSHFYARVSWCFFKPAHSQQGPISRRGYGDPDQRERIPCLGHPWRRCGPYRKTRPRAAGRRAGRGRCVCRRTARPARRSGRRGAAAFGARLRLYQYIQAQMYQLRIQQASAVFAVSSSFRPQGLRDTAAFWLRQRPWGSGNATFSTPRGCTVPPSSSKEISNAARSTFSLRKARATKHMPRRPHPPAPP